MRILNGVSAMLRFDNGPKRPTNLTLNAKVLDMARELGINLSQTVDALLTEEVRKRYWERWNEQNRDAVQAYNDRIEREGLPLARHRTFMKGR
jgi:antitoxin CcdA